MQGKTIKAILSKKFNRFVDSIEDAHVRKLVKENTIITGGAIASMLMNEDVKDFDLYFTNKETVLAVCKYYTDWFNKENDHVAEVLDGATMSDEKKRAANMDSDRVKIFIKSAGVALEKGATPLSEQPFEDVYDVLEEDDETYTEEENPKKPYRPVFLSSNAITLNKESKVQLIIRFYGDADEIHSNYDFVHCTNYWESKGNKLTLRPEAVLAILNKKLIYQGSKYPLCSIIRTRKFIKRGFNIDAGQMLKMMFQISSLDLNDVKVLEDQLVGVDSAYFQSLINAINSKMKSDPDFTVSEGMMSGYITTLIDKIFLGE